MLQSVVPIVLITIPLFLTTNGATFECRIIHLPNRRYVADITFLKGNYSFQIVEGI